jgi:hypothetical protein
MRSDRRHFVAAEEYDEVRSEYDQAHGEVAELIAVVRQVAWVTPRPGEGERTWQSLRSHAQAALTP